MEVRTELEQGAQAHGFEADLWTLERVGLVVERMTGVSLSLASVWRLLTDRLGGGVWSAQSGGRSSGMSPRSPVGSRTNGRASKRGPHPHGLRLGIVRKTVYLPIMEECTCDQREHSQGG
ncbi:winged helix-turn-helix domain-containing protein [Streptomyces sp. NPDC048362]|uniref:winged helix-turn-helix domain-containing protein n=1 Tax=Streptomyces sp. NPDC048362 TaxID=3365539 RepID=UPI00371BF4B4